MTKIKLFQPPPVWGLPNMSPFCVKLETYLKMAQIPYETCPADFSQAPLGRIPYVEIDGKLMGDTTLIMNRLKKLYGDPLDENLDAKVKALGIAIQRIFEDHLYFAGLVLRWTLPESWKYVKEVFLPMIPSTVRPVLGGWILNRVRAAVLKGARDQGMGEHSLEEIIEFAKEDLTVISELLGDSPFMLGANPTSVDAIAYGFLIQQLWVPWDHPIKEHVQSLPRLTSYCHRMKERVWA